MKKQKVDKQLINQPDCKCIRIMLPSGKDQIRYTRYLTLDDFRQPRRIYIFEEIKNYKGLKIYCRVQLLPVDLMLLENFKDDYIEVRRKKNGNIRLRIFCDCSKMNINHSKRTEYISYTFLISGTYTNLYYDRKKYSKKNIRLKEEKKQQRIYNHLCYNPTIKNKSKPDVKTNIYASEWNASHPYSGGGCSPR